MPLSCFHGSAANAKLVRPIVEVESPATALALAERGVGDTVISLPLAHVLGATANLHWNSFEHPLYETFAFITRRGATLSPATEIVIRLARQLLGQLPRSTRLPGTGRVGIPESPRVPGEQPRPQEAR